MVASGIFFMCVFAILAMVSSVLRNARSLRRTELDAGMVAAKLVGVTNKFFEGTESGDFGNLYPGYSYDADTYEVATNGLYQNPGYANVGININYALGRGLTAYGDLRNALNQHYEEVFGYPSLRLNFVAGMKWTLGD